MLGSFFPEPWSLAQPSLLGRGGAGDPIQIKSAIGEAIDYTLSNWEALLRYVEDGDLQIDDTGAEHSLRPIVVGRRNWIFYGSDKLTNGAGTEHPDRKLQARPHRANHLSPPPVHAH